MRRRQTLSLGPLRNTGEVWVNGQSLTPAPFVPPAPAPAPPGARRCPGSRGPGGGRGNAPTYVIPGERAFVQGSNTITVRIQNQRNEGGFLGTPDVMYLEGSGASRVPLAGTWKYRVERQTNAGALYTKPGQLAAHVAFTAEGGAAGAAGTALPPVAPQAPDVAVRLSVIPGQMKFDKTELNVAPGQLVEVVYTNSDVMQHNFVLGAPGSLTAIGEAGDRLATSPSGLTQGYVPDICRKFSSRRNSSSPVRPRHSNSERRQRQDSTRTYATFPAHWRTMNGVLNVIMPAGRGGRGGGVP